MPSDTSDSAVEQIPSSPHRRLTFDGGDIVALARYAKFHRGDPDRLYLFGARELEMYGREVKPPWGWDEDEPRSTMFACFFEGVVAYFLENWREFAEEAFAQNWLVIELHELTHWAVDEEDDETGTDHWDPWNQKLAEVAEYVMPVEDWQLEGFEPPERETEEPRPQPEQVTLTEVVDT